MELFNVLIFKDGSYFETLIYLEKKKEQKASGDQQFQNYFKELHPKRSEKLKNMCNFEIIPQHSMGLL